MADPQVNWLTAPGLSTAAASALPPDGAATGWQLFETAIGRCGIAWTPRGIAAVHLPQQSDAALMASMRRRLRQPGFDTLAAMDCDQAAQMPSQRVQSAIDGVVRLLQGEHDSLLHIVLDMSGVPTFHRAVYQAARHIAPGQTATYGQLAQRLGEPGAARAVGQALGHNPFAPVVPCHRVLAAGARSGGFSAEGGVHTKLRMLLIERAAFGAPGLFD